MRSSWLYLATRSERHSEPVLIWVAVVATAISAMVVSSVSPERCDTTAAYRRIGHRDRFQGFGQRADLVDLDQDRVGDALVDAFARIFGLVTNKSSPTSCTLRRPPGQQFPAGPVALGHAVLDGDDRVGAHQPAR
jgi:hypothetical protein